MSVTDDPSVLVIAGFGRRRDGDIRTEKIETHLEPIAAAGIDVTYLSPSSSPTDAAGITYRPVAALGWYPLVLLAQWFAAIRLARRHDYDHILSFSLVPYGLMALVTGWLSRRPTHLGILGIDLDVHADASYGPLVRWAFRRFDLITVAGEAPADRLRACGVPRHRIAIVSHPVSDRFLDGSVRSEPTYDLLWIGRFNAEKDPLLFLDSLAALGRSGREVKARMIGSGPLEAEIHDRRKQLDLETCLTVTGWLDDPLPAYEDARIYVNTSDRELLPLTLVESMQVGLTPVVPPLGAIPDLVTNDRNGIVYRERDPGHLAARIGELLDEDEAMFQLSHRASKAASELTIEAVGDRWHAIIAGGDRLPDHSSPGTR